MKKKLLAVLLAGVLTVGIPQMAFATGAETTDSDTADSEPETLKSEDGKWEYYVDEEKGGAVIDKYIGEEVDVIIPEKIDDTTTVVGIGNWAFEKTKVVSIKMPDTIKFMDNGALGACDTLQTVTLSNSLTGIYPEVFYMDKSLTDITIPEGVEYLATYSFKMSGLKSIKLPATLTYIGDEVFSNCTNLESIVIPDNVTEIDNGAFAYCTSLSEITLPKSLEVIGGQAFDNCVSLTKITIPDSIQEIHSYAFYGCTTLEEITLPNTIKTMKPIFGDCPALKKIIFNGTQEEWDAIAYAKDEETSLPIGEYEDLINVEIICTEEKPSSGSSSSSSSSSTTTTTPEPTEYTDAENETGVTASADEGVLPDGAELVVTPVTSETSDSKFTYDISFKDTDGKEVQPKGEVTVKVPVPEKFKDAEKVYVYRAETDGTYTDMKAEVKDGFVVFTTNHFSKYLVTTEEIKAETPAPETPKPTDTTPADTTTNPNTGVAVALIPAILAGAVVIVSAKKRK